MVFTRKCHSKFSLDEDLLDYSNTELPTAALVTGNKDTNYYTIM